MEERPCDEVFHLKSAIVMRASHGTTSNYCELDPPRGGHIPRSSFGTKSDRRLNGSPFVGTLG